MKPVYLDYAATTPLRKEVLSAMVKVLEREQGNPSSLHEDGRSAKKVLETARTRIAEFIGARPTEIIFTSSGTEANNLAIFGVLRRFLERNWRNTLKGDLAGISSHAGEPVHVITSSIEHSSVRNCFLQLEELGAQVTYLPVSSEGVVDVKAVENAMTDHTKLVSVMMVNNEIGTIQPIAEISNICKKHGVLLHTDAIQAVGKIPVHFHNLGVDLLSFSGHKLYGPKGIGVLCANRKSRLDPILFGGGQERGLRPGTENIALVQGLAVALELCLEHMEDETRRIEYLHDVFTNEICSRIQDIKFTAGNALCLPHIAHLSLPDVLGEAVLLELDRYGFCVSAAAACSSGKAEPSHVMQAIGLTERYIHGSLRVSFGLHTTEEDVLRFARVLDREVMKLQEMVFRA